MATATSKEEQSEPQAIVADEEKTESHSNAPTLREPVPDEKQTKPEDGDVPTENESDNEEPEWLTGWKLTSMMTSLTLAAFLMLLDMSIISTVREPSLNRRIVESFLSAYRIQAIPRITSDFHSLTDIGWYASAYNLAR